MKYNLTKLQIPLLAVLFCFSSSVHASENSCLGFSSETSTSATDDRDMDGVPDDKDLCVGSVQGLSDVSSSTGCPGKVEPFEAITFLENDPLHKVWYTHFWDGKCSGLEGHPCAKGLAWLDIVEKLTSSNDRELLRAQLWSAGRYIGYEWAKENSKISTFGDLIIWGRDLEELHETGASTERLEEALANICATATLRLTNE